MMLADNRMGTAAKASASIDAWHVITGEYPPHPGGVSDYTQQLVNGLVAHGSQVHVWTRGCDSHVEQPQDNLFIHRYAGDFGLRSLTRLSRELEKFEAPRRILVQYVPHAYGFKAMNLAFAAWVRSRKSIDDVRLMFHEVAYPWVMSPLRHNIIAAANECMARMMISAASSLYVSTTAWNERLIRLGASPSNVCLLPIPSNIPTATDSAAIETIRQTLCKGNDTPGIIGHFGTYGANARSVLLPIVQKWLAQSNQTRLHWIGGGSDAWAAELRDRFPESRMLMSSTGRVSPWDVADHIAACDVMLQPYGDGVTTRRTSLMACMANRRATVSTHGRHSESLWSKHDLIRLGNVSNASESVEHLQTLLQSANRRAELGKRAYQYYQQHFSLEHSLATLRGATHDGR